MTLNYILLGAVLSIVLFMGGCVAGVERLGVATLADGSQREYWHVGSKGQDGPKKVIIKEFALLEKPDGSLKAVDVGTYEAAGPSLTSDILRNAGAAAVISGGHVMGQVVAAKGAAKVAEIRARGDAAAAALRRPDTTSVSLTGGSYEAGDVDLTVSADSSSDSQSDSYSESYAETYQEQYQDQYQEQYQDQYQDQHQEQEQIFEGDDNGR